MKLELDEPFGGWPAFLKSRGVPILRDDLGRQALDRADFARLIGERNESERRHVDEERRRAEEAAEAASRPRAPIGVPALDGATPFESMMAAEAATGAYTTPHREFGGVYGSPATEMLEEAFADGRRRTAEKRRKIRERDAQKEGSS